MKREYKKWRSKELSRDMELLIFGDRGDAIIFFPTRTARYFDYEGWKVLDNIEPKIDARKYQFYCVDSIDDESFYHPELSAADKIKRHLQYEAYILNEVIPLIRKKNPKAKLISAGCSLGAYHAANIAFRHPHLFTTIIGMSGRYDLTMAVHTFKDLLGGATSEDIYYNMPTQFLANLNDPYILEQMQKLKVILAIGKEDAFLQNNLWMAQILNSKYIYNELHFWEGEAHKPFHWRQMLDLYLP